MTRLRGATVKQFKDALEVMRSVYPYEDERTIISSDINRYTEEHSCLEITTRDDTGVVVNLSCDVKAVTGRNDDADQI